MSALHVAKPSSLSPRLELRQEVGNRLSPYERSHKKRRTPANAWVTRTGERLRHVCGNVTGVRSATSPQRPGDPPGRPGPARTIARQGWPEGRRAAAYRAAMHFDLTDLRLQVHVAESNSLTRGAERSHMSLPAANTRIKNLEDSGAGRVPAAGVEPLSDHPPRRQHRPARAPLVVPACHALADAASVDFAHTLELDHVGLHEVSAIHAFLRQVCDTLHRQLQLRIQVGNFEGRLAHDRGRHRGRHPAGIGDLVDLLVADARAAEARP